MRKILWEDLFYGTLDQFADGSYPRKVSWSPERFPALRHLADCSDPEILLLAWLISYIEAKPHHQQQSFVAIEEGLRDFDYPSADIEAALDKLTCRGWVTMHLREDGNLYYGAHRAQLEREGLFAYNPWYHLSELGLYYDLCDN